jgi:hypothetical protein
LERSHRFSINVQNLAKTDVLIMEVMGSPKQHDGAITLWPTLTNRLFRARALDPYDMVFRRQTDSGSMFYAQVEAGMRQP